MLAVSEAMKRDMAALGLPADRIRVHRTGVDLDRFAPLDRPSLKGALGVAGPLVVAVGPLIERNGHAIVIEAMLGVTDAPLLLAGDGPDPGRLHPPLVRPRPPVPVPRHGA